MNNNASKGNYAKLMVEFTCVKCGKKEYIPYCADMATEDCAVGNVKLPEDWTLCVGNNVLCPDCMKDYYKVIESYWSFPKPQEWDDAENAAAHALR